MADSINKAFFDDATGVYIDMLQTHLVMPLASGVVPPSAECKTTSNLEQSIRVLQKGHLDTGLTGTYFLMKFLTEQGRNDLIFTMANQTTFPGYGYFLEKGFTTWPEDWTLGHDVSKKTGVSKMHGCYTSIGLWFVQGVAGITVDAADVVPLTIRAGVDAGDLSWARGSRAAPQGEVESAWEVGLHGFNHNVTVPGNAVARVMIPALAEEDVTESGVPLRSARGVVILGVESINRLQYVKLKVGSGRYRFFSSWTRGANMFSPTYI